MEELYFRLCQAPEQGLPVLPGQDTRVPGLAGFSIGPPGRCPPGVQLASRVIRPGIIRFSANWSILGCTMRTVEVITFVIFCMCGRFGSSMRLFAL